MSKTAKDRERLVALWATQMPWVIRRKLVTEDGKPFAGPPGNYTMVLVSEYKDPKKKICFEVYRVGEINATS